MFPLALPGVVIAAVLCFILCMNAFTTPLLYSAFKTDNNWPFGAAIAFILMATTLLLTLVANHMVPSRYRG